MAVNPRSLDTPEKGMVMESREDPKQPGAVAELRRLRERIVALRALAPPEAPKVDAYSKDWWKRGWEAGWKAALEALAQD